MDYSEALKQQLNLLTWWRSEEGRRAAKVGALQSMNTFGMAPSPEHFWMECVGELTRAEPFFVSAQIGQTLVVMAENLPDITLQMDDIPVLAGFVYLEQPFLIASDGLSVRAFSWEAIEVGPPDEPQQDKLTDVSMSFYTDKNGRWQLCSQLAWPFGDSWQGWRAARGTVNLEVKKTLENMRKMVMCFLQFIKQPFVVTHKEQPNRSLRRLVESAKGRPIKLQEMPIVRTVLLRRNDQDGAHIEGGSDREYRCQWVVRGHWRQQACGAGRSVRRATWISPYVKGPEDKPLKTPRATVFAVVR